MKKILIFTSILITSTFFIPDEAFAGHNKKEQQHQRRKKSSSQTRKKTKRTVADSHQNLPQTPPTSQKRKKIKTTEVKSPQKNPAAAPPPPPPAPEFSMALMKKGASLSPQNQESTDKNKKGKKKFFKMTQGLKELLQVGKGTLKKTLSNSPQATYNMTQGILSSVILRKVAIDQLPEVIGGKKPPAQAEALIVQTMGIKVLEELRHKSEQRQGRARYVEWIKTEARKPDRQALFKELKDTTSQFTDSEMTSVSYENLEKKIQKKQEQLRIFEWRQVEAQKPNWQALSTEIRDTAIFIDHEMIIESCEELDKKTQEKNIKSQKKKNKIKKMKRQIRLIKKLEEDKEKLDAERKQLLAQLEEKQELEEQEKKRKKSWWIRW